MPLDQTQLEVFVRLGSFGAPNVTEAVRHMAALAKSAKSVVRMMFNGVEVVARPGETQKAIIARYHEKLEKLKESKP